MSDFSRLPQRDLENALKEGYIGIYFEQGVPILDRDLNLLQSLVAENVRSIVRSFIGDGVPTKGSGFQIKAIPADNDFLISAGKCLVDGIEVNLGADLNYSAQKPRPGALTTPSSGTRTDTVYLELSLQTVEGSSGDRDLLNEGDVGVQTSVRVKRAWTVRVAEGGALPARQKDHARHTLARITRPANQARIEQRMITDLRRTGMSLDDVESRMREIERLRATPTLRPGKEFEPEAGNAGLEVRIFGRNLDVFPVHVLFDDILAPDPTTIETNRLVVTVPSQHEGGDAVITVTTGDGAEKREVESTRKFKVLTEGPMLALPPNDLSPPSAPEGGTVTLKGTNLNIGDVIVKFGEIQVPPAGIVARQPDTLVVVVPTGLTRPVKVTVETSAGGPVETDTEFTIAFRPIFDASPFDEPAATVGETVTLNGQHFTGLQGVQFKKRSGPPVPVDRNDFSLVDDRHIETKVPSGAAGPCTVIVVTAGGQASSPAELFVSAEG